MRFTPLTIIFGFISYALTAQVAREKDIAYLSYSTPGFNAERHALDVYYPKDTTVTHDVFVFFHGGSWRGGKKDTYRFIGKRMARKGFVAVMVNYRLAPNVRYEQMAEDCAYAVDWIYKNISKYGGAPDKITVAGHSAGGHLAALISLNGTFENLGLKNPIHKTILIDAFGLDMYSYFSEYHNDYSRRLFETFPSDRGKWKEASPIHAIRPGVTIPFQVFAGGKTYPAIIKSSSEFSAKLNGNGGCAEYHVIRGKRHIGMITQLFFRSKNRVYEMMTDFIKEKD